MMMKNHNLVLVAVLIGALCIIFPLAKTQQNGNTLLKEYNIFVGNNYTTGDSMGIHCRSSDDDLGAHVIPAGQVYHFGTKIDVFRTTLFNCSVEVGTKDLTYAALKATRDEDRCSNHYYCLWSVRLDGIYFSSDNANWYNAFPW